MYAPFSAATLIPVPNQLLLFVDRSGGWSRIWESYRKNSGESKEGRCGRA